MIEYIVIGAVAWTFAVGIFPIACAMLKVEDPYIPSREYAEDFAARMSGEQSPAPATPFPAGSGDDTIVDFRRLGTGPRGNLQNVRTTPVDASLGRSAAETDRPLHLVRP